MTMQHKTFEFERKEGWIVASTPTVDRSGDRVMPYGINLESYRKNPVLIYGHSYSDPANVIGRAAEISIDEHGLRILPELREPASDNDPMHIIKALWDQGLLRAASIGFRPLQMMRNAFGGQDITELELLEVSLTPIPANQEALRIVAKSLDITEPEQEAIHKDGEVQAEEAAQEVKEAAQEEEVTTEAGQASPAANDQPTPEQELRLAAILADFISSIRPYLSTGVQQS